MKELQGELPMRLFKVQSGYQTWWLNIADIVAIETIGPEGKPAGWHELCAAALTMRNVAVSIPLDHDQWAELRRLLGMENEWTGKILATAERLCADYRRRTT